MQTFSETPDFVYADEEVFRTSISEMDDGSEQRGKRWATSRRRFVCNFMNRTTTEKDAIQDFFQARAGAYEAFYFTNPVDSTQYTVRFERDSLTIGLKAYGVYDISVALVSVL